MLSDPAGDHLLACLTQLDVLGALASSPRARRLDVCAESAHRFTRHVMRRSGVDGDIEAQVTEASREIAALWRRRGMGERSLRRIGEKGYCDFGPTHAVCLGAMVARD